LEIRSKLCDFKQLLVPLPILLDFLLLTLRGIDCIILLGMWCLLTLVRLRLLGQGLSIALSLIKTHEACDLRAHDLRLVGYRGDVVSLVDLGAKWVCSQGVNLVSFDF
jgi:hypothetical protein